MPAPTLPTTIVALRSTPRAAAPVPGYLPALGPGHYRRLGTATGIASNYLSRILRGDVSPTLATLQRISSAAGVTLDQLAAHIHAARAMGVKGSP